MFYFSKYFSSSRNSEIVWQWFKINNRSRLLFLSIRFMTHSHKSCVCVCIYYYFSPLFHARSSFFFSSFVFQFRWRHSRLKSLAVAGTMQRRHEDDDDGGVGLLLLMARTTSPPMSTTSPGRDRPRRRRPTVVSHPSLLTVVLVIIIGKLKQSLLIINITPISI